MTSVGQIGLNLVLNGSSFKKQLIGIQGQAETASTKITNSFKKVGLAVATVFSAKAIMNFGKSCIDLGSNLAEVQNVVDTVFSDMSGKLNTWAKEAAANYGLSETMAKKYAGLYGSMADASGLSEKATYDMATALTGLAGDVASFYNISQDEAYTKLKAVFSGETEVLKDLGIVMTQDALNSYALAKGINKSVNDMTQAEKVSLRYNFILEQLSNAQGDFVRTQDNWANQVRVLKLRFESLKATIGQGLIQAFTPVLKMVSALIARAQTLAEAFSSAMSSIFGVSANTPKAVTSTVAAEQELTNSADDSAAAVDSVTDSINDSAKAAKGSLASFDKLNVLSQPDTSSSGNSSSATPITAANTTGALTDQINKLADEAVKIWDSKSKKLIESVKTTLKSLKTSIGSIKESWNDVWNNGSGQKLLNNIKSLLAHIVKNVGYISDAFNKAWKKGKLGKGVIQSIIDKANSLIELIDTIADDFNKVWNNGTGEKIWTNILTIIRNCNNYTATWRNKIKEAWEENDTGEKLWQDILGVVEDITGWLKDMSAIRLEWVENLDLSPVVEAVEKLAGAFRELLKVCGDKLKSAYKNILLPLAKWTIEKAVPKLVEMLAKALDFVAKVVKKIDIKAIGAIAAAVLTVVGALKALEIAKTVKRYINTIISNLRSLWTSLKAMSLSSAIGLIVTAVAALAAACATYCKLKWENSELKKQSDQINEYSEEIQECADTLRETREEFENTELELRADFTQVDDLKTRLQELIADGTIDESEMAEYKTVVDLLKERVDGFEEYWDGLELEEVEGKIGLNPDVKTVTDDIDTIIDKWKELQYAELYSEEIKTLGTQRTTLQIDIDVAKGNVNDALKNLEDYLKKNGNTYYEVGGIDGYIKAYKEGKIKFGLLDSEGKAVTETYISAKEALDDYNTSLSLSDQKYYDAWNKSEALNCSTTNYSGILGLVEDGLLSEEEAMERLKGTGIDSMEQLQLKATQQDVAQKNATASVDDTASSYTTMSDTAQNSMQKTSDATNELSKNAKKNANAVQTGYSGAFSGVISAAHRMWTKLKSIFSNNTQLKDSLKNMFIGALNWLIDGINNLISSVVGHINNAFSGVRDWEILGKKPFGWLPTFDAPQIPKFAKGGIIKAPTLAVVGDNPGANTGDPEIVAPLSKLNGMIGGNDFDDTTQKHILDYLKRIYEILIVYKNQGGNSYQFIAQLDGSTLFEEFIKQNELYKRRHGGKSPV